MNILIVFAGAIIVYLLRLLTIPALIFAALMAYSFIIINPLLLVPPLTFFLFSSLWTRWPGKSKRDKRRNIKQVAANGGVAFVVALINIIIHMEGATIIISASFAAAAADTWATEWGSSLGGSPLSLKTFRYTEPGESGAISIVGSLAMVSGAISVALSGYIIGLYSFNLLIPISIAGIVGAMVDSFAGAYVQALWRDSSGKIAETREPKHIYNQRICGLSWVNNDVVNLLATLSSAIVVWVWIS